MSKNTFYFSHDYAARHDLKLIKLQREMGLEGIGIFWCIVEMLYEHGGELQTDYDSIAYELRTDSERIANVVRGYNLFIIEGEIFYSQTVKMRLAERIEKSEKAKLSAQKRWETKEKNANALPTQSERNAKKERKGKEIKENIKENIKEKFGESVHLTLEEKTKLESTYGIELTEKMISKLDTYKLSNGKKYKSDYHAILSWVS